MPNQTISCFLYDLKTYDINCLYLTKPNSKLIEFVLTKHVDADSL